MMRKKPKLTLVDPQTKISPSPHVSSDRISPRSVLNEARSDLLSDDKDRVCRGAWGLRRLAENGEFRMMGEEDLLAFMQSIALRLKYAVRENLQAKVYLSETLLFLAKDGIDIGPALSAVPACLSDSDFHVRNRTLLAMGHYCKAGGEISDFIETMLPCLKDVAPGNREAAVWALNTYASLGKHEAHHLLLALGPEGSDDVNSADVRMTCYGVLRE